MNGMKIAVTALTKHQRKMIIPTHSKIVRAHSKGSPIRLSRPRSDLQWKKVHTPSFLPLALVRLTKRAIGVFAFNAQF